MTPPPPELAASDEIHAHALDRLNLALRHLGMFAGENPLRVLLDTLLFVERRPETWEQQVSVWQERGMWTEYGISGVFRTLWPGTRYDDDTASVYAEFARRCGWLAPDRVLDGPAFAALREEARHWAAEDRTWTRTLERFGEPSLLCGSPANPRFPKAVGYTGPDPEEPMVWFHFWNGTAPGDRLGPCRYEEPMLMALRCGEQEPFRRTLTFTPEGNRRRPVA
ncbi:hypothetical protein [Streptomyces clavuligerus]|uniref:Uncharacterized protein n=1 Tax=Streptomyces clavuligerus TaxID=1901 RepID=E2Q0G8_STRCL|nr:hypothetical protein [Streptomyces clavuligerus]ANW16963.1 hypothetical protein BB341_01315 [Streptomyces clavuligerus]AXU11492.1 hypothetical protein D1794_01390 [Streptomyces clavuligerus]EFG10511.1 Hypothetical protein SCLAV_5444 [Streptomyces clavuligerus]MBY6301311.1 hypothetical protein [Streptomyces clavuligerus]QCS04364.1 hypothetical protein CRV15_01390 [Streptomyces clavuligerus]